MRCVDRVVPRLFANRLNGHGKQSHIQAENRIEMIENNNNPSPGTVIASGLHQTSQWVHAEGRFGLSVTCLTALFAQMPGDQRCAGDPVFVTPPHYPSSKFFASSCNLIPHERQGKRCVVRGFGTPTAS